MSPPDGETSYFEQFIHSVSTAVPNVKEFLSSPYYTSSNNLPHQANILAQFCNQVPGLTYIAPQDGAGSFGYSTNITGTFFKDVAETFKNQKVKTKLWANVETFLPRGQICKAAPESRIQDQINAVSNSVESIINFWAYNLPGAKNIPCNFY